MPAVRSRLSPRIGLSLRLQESVVGLNSVLGVPGGVVESGRQKLHDHPHQDMGPVSGNHGSLAVGIDRCDEEAGDSLQVPPLGQEHVDDLAVLVDRPVDVAPRAGDLDVGLVHEPMTTDGVAARPGRLDQQRSEPLDCRNRVTWSTSILRSARSSSRSR
jgi:hypothetical protein